MVRFVCGLLGALGQRVVRTSMTSGLGTECTERIDWSVGCSIETMQNKTVRLTAKSSILHIKSHKYPLILNLPIFLRLQGPESRAICNKIRSEEGGAHCLSLASNYFGISKECMVIIQIFKPTNRQSN